MEAARAGFPAVPASASRPSRHLSHFADDLSRRREREDDGDALDRRRWQHADLRDEAAGVEVGLASSCSGRSAPRRLRPATLPAEPAFLPVGGEQRFEMTPDPRPQRRTVGPEQLGFTRRPRRANEAGQHARHATGAPRRGGRRRDVGLQRPSVGLKRDQADPFGKGCPGMVGAKAPGRHRLGVDDCGQQGAGHRSKCAAGQCPGSDHPGEQAIRRLEQLRQVGGGPCREPRVGELDEGAAGAIGVDSRRPGGRAAARDTRAVRGGPRRSPSAAGRRSARRRAGSRRGRRARPRARWSSPRVHPHPSAARAGDEGRDRRTGPLPSGCTRRSLR